MNAEIDALRAARKRPVRFTWILAGTILFGALGYALSLGVTPWRGLYLTVETLAYPDKSQKQGGALVIQITLLRVGTLVTQYAGKSA